MARSPAVRGPKLVVAVVVSGMVALFLTPAAAQVSSAVLEGRVLDVYGGALAGARVRLTSAGGRPGLIATADPQGRFRYVVFEPGSYDLEIALDGYEPRDVAGLDIRIGDRLRLEIQLRLDTPGGLSATPPPPEVLRTMTSVGLHVTEDLLRDLPTGRDVVASAPITPGVWPDAVGLAVYGSTGAESAFSIDGLDTTGIELGLDGTRLPPEFVQDMQVTTAAYPAEFGRSTGGIVNVATRSGGNALHGDIFGFWEGNGLRADPSRSASTAGGAEWVRDAGWSRTEYGFTVGGPIVRDRLWFFTAFDRVDGDASFEYLVDSGGALPLTPSRAQRLDRTTTRDRYLVKLEWQPDPSHTVTASLFGDPTRDEGLLPGASLAGTPLSFSGEIDTGGRDGVVAVEGLVGDDVVWSARVGRHRDRRRLGGPGAAAPAYLDFTEPLGDGTVTFGWQGRESGFDAHTNLESHRDDIDLDVSTFLDDLAGHHELKAGIGFQDATTTADFWSGGAGQRIYRFACDPTIRYCGEPGAESPFYYRHLFYVSLPLGDPHELGPEDVLTPLVVETGAESPSAFVQDRWQVTPGLTVNLGLRWERQRLLNSDSDTAADIEDSWAPRLGFVWDATGDGRTRVYGHVGRYVSRVPMSTVVRAFSRRFEISTYNLSDDPGDVADDPHVFVNRVIPDPFVAVDPNIAAEAMDEIVAGAEVRISSDLTVGLMLIRRDLQRVIEDALGADGRAAIGNPGEGLLASSYDLGYAYGYGCPDGTDDCHQHPVVKPERRFEGLELVARKRFSNRWSVIASLLLSRLEGNYDGTYQTATGELDPHLSSAYAYSDFSVNGNGDLAADRRVQIRFDGIYRFDWGLVAGLSAHYRSGTPVTAMGTVAGFDRPLYFLSRRGAFGRTDAEYEADLHLGYPVALGSDLGLEVVADIFNLLDRQGETGRDNRYTLHEDYRVIDWTTGVTNPPIGPSDSERPPTNPAFNSADRWQPPRSVRLGIRLSF